MKKGGKKKKKKEKPPYNYKYPQLNYEELKKVPLFNFTAKNGSLKNSNDDIVTGSIPMDYSFNKIKELIQQKHGDSCSNLRLYMKDDNTGEKKYLDSLEYKTLQELGFNGSSCVVFFEFDPYVHPTLEAILSD